MFAYLFLAVLVMAPFFGDLFTVGRRRNSTDRLPSPQARQHSGGGLSSRQVGLCEVCGKRQKFVENSGFVHPYCGRTCARACQSTCNYPSCTSPGKSTFSGYCGPGHARNAVIHGYALACVECRKQPQAMGNLCLGCNNSTGKLSEPRLKELDLHDPKTNSIITHFQHQWKGPGPVNIGRIYEIQLPRHITKSREAYSSKLATVSQPRQIQTFHSTQCICDLGTSNSRFCSYQSCGICAIIKSAFATFEFGAKSNSGRFGSGVYSYLESSLADRHAVSTTSSPYRVMLACEVNLLPHRAQPPKFSGILQSHEEGQSVFVSGAEAIVPKYLILYSKPATTPPMKSPSRVSLLS